MRRPSWLLVSWLVLVACLGPASAGFKQPEATGEPVVLPSVGPIRPVVPEPPAFSPAPPGSYQLPGRPAPPVETPGAGAEPSPRGSPASASPSAAPVSPTPRASASPQPSPAPRHHASNPWIPVMVVIVLVFVWLLPTRDLFGKGKAQPEESADDLSFEMPRMKPIARRPPTKPSS